MIGWGLYAVQVGLLIVIVAWSAEAMARLARQPVRFVWIAALLLCVGFPVGAHLAATRIPAEAAQLGSAGPFDFVQTGVALVQQRAPVLAAGYLLGVWGVASLLVALCFATVYWRMRRASRTWPATQLNGHQVRVSPSTGPMLLGVVRPEIIVPRWVITRSTDEQRVILAHEAEHISARDHLVLSVACTFAVLFPWNPAIWIILSRLRFAIEMDCDARVLGRGISPRSYCSLLVDVAECSSPFLLATTSFGARASHLHQRILAMQPAQSTRPIVRSAAIAFVGVAAFLAACESKMPTAADIAGMDAAAAQKNAAPFVTMSDSSVVWVVDGSPSDAAAAKRIPADSIASVRVEKAKGHGQIYLTTKRDQRDAIAVKGEPLATGNRRATRIAFTPKSDQALVKVPGAQPLLIIDGAKALPVALAKLDRLNIEKVEVLKGAAAAAAYGDDGKDGVVIITTKTGNGH